MPMNSTLNIQKKLPFYEFFYPYEKDKLSLEYRLKCYYLKHPEEQLDTMHKFSEKDGVFLHLLSSNNNFDNIIYPNINESFKIEDGFDISLTRHIRYLPAYIHSHQFFELAIVMEGSCTNYIGTQTIQMNVGDICIIAPGTLHTISAFSDECILLNCLIRSTTFEQTFFDVISDQPVLSDFFSQALYQKNESFYLLFHTNEDEELRQIIYNLYGEYSAHKKYSQKVMNYYMSIFFTLLIRNHEKDVIIPNPTHRAPEYNIIYILHYLQNHYATISLKELSTFFNYSERQMGRILHDYTGLSFSENIKKFKMMKAAKLLTSQNTSITEIAAQCGYSNSSHFRKTFIQYYGLTPLEYRKQNTSVADT